MKRSLPALLLVLCSLAACSDDAPGKLEPIPRPEGYVDPPKPEAPKKPAVPAPDPNKVTLRWKLAPKAPQAFRLTGTPEGGDAKLVNSYVLERPEKGDLVLRIATEGVAPTDQGTFSERGFILDGLSPVDATLTTLWLELPRDPVGVGDKWSLAADPVDVQPLGPDFVEKKSDRRNSAKLTALAPEGDERVATIEYDIYERINGAVVARPPPLGHAHHAAPGKKDAKKDAKKEEGHHEEEPKPPPEITAEVSFTGRGEFLVKAGRWRSWQGTLTAKTEGYTASSPEKALTRVPAGSFKLQLTELDSPPPQLQAPEKK